MIDKALKVVREASRICENHFDGFGMDTAETNLLDDLDDLVKELDQNQWILCSDRLPQIKEGRSRDYLIATKNRIFIGYITQYDEEFEPQWKLQGRDGYNVDDVICWKPLPENPVEV